MAKVSEKVQEAIFTQLLNIPANNECADCRTSSPTWVSLDFGVFLCMRCSGVHRQIGPHITRVRSVRLDGWTKDNIEIMATVGNQVANDYYEHTMTNYSRKPGTGSSPEECRRFVDDKYIHKKFAVEGYPEPVKDFVACRSKGTKPDFSYSNQSPSTQVQQKQPEPHLRTHSENPHASNHTSLRKKSMSLDKLKPAPSQPNNQHYQHHDLLSADEDLLGGGAPSHTQHNNAHFQAHANSASPAKINFAKFKKAGNAQQQPQENPSTTQWNVDLTGGDHGQGQGQGQQQQQSQNQPQNQPQTQNNMFNNLYNPQQQQQQAPPQQNIDLKQLYNQGGHQNHFMQNQQRQGWGFQGMNQPQPGFQGGFQGGYQGGPTGMPQNNMQYNQGYGMQPGYNQQTGGFQQQGQMGFGGNTGGNAQMGYNQGFGQGQHGGYNQHQGQGFVQVQNANKFF